MSRRLDEAQHWGETSVAALEQRAFSDIGLKLDGELMEEVEHVLTVQLEHHLDRRLKSLQFLHDMRTRS